jgi:hypothetical protein
VPTSSLSASGSAIRPNVVTRSRERAMCPSAASVSAAAPKTAAAAGIGPVSSPSSSTSSRGTNAIRLSVSTFGRLSGTKDPYPRARASIRQALSSRRGGVARRRSIRHPVRTAPR